MTVAIQSRGFTTTFAASERLAELLAAHNFGSGVKVSWGYPGEAAAAEIVWVGGFESADQEPAAVGQGRRDESYLISVFVDIVLQGKDPAVAARRAGELVRGVEQVVAEHHGLDGVVMWAQVADVETVVEPMVMESGVGTVQRVRVGCRSRI